MNMLWRNGHVLVSLLYLYCSFGLNSACPEGFNVEDTDGTCYWRSSASVTWLESLNACALKESRLVRIDSNEKAVFLENNFPIYNWIALNDQLDEAHYEYPDGYLAGIHQTPSVGGYLNWNSGQPNDENVQDCVIQSSGGWEDKDCQDRYTFICEVPAWMRVEPPSNLPPQRSYRMLSSQYNMDPENVMKEITVTGKYQCPLECLRHKGCLGYYLLTSQSICRLVTSVRVSTGSTMPVKVWVSAF